MEAPGRVPTELCPQPSSPDQGQYEGFLVINYNSLPAGRESWEAFWLIMELWKMLGICALANGLNI